MAVCRVRALLAVRVLTLSIAASAQAVRASAKQCTPFLGMARAETRTSATFYFLADGWLLVSVNHVTTRFQRFGGGKGKGKGGNWNPPGTKAAWDPYGAVQQAPKYAVSFIVHLGNC